MLWEFHLNWEKKKKEQDPDKEIKTKPGLLLAGLYLGAWYYPMCCKRLTNASLGKNKTLICSLCRFPCYKYSQHWIKNWDKTHTVCSSEPAPSSLIIQPASLQLLKPVPREISLIPKCSLSPLLTAHWALNSHSTSPWLSRTLLVWEWIRFPARVSWSFNPTHRSPLLLCRERFIPWDGQMGPEHSGAPVKANEM